MWAQNIAFPVLKTCFPPRNLYIFLASLIALLKFKPMRIALCIASFYIELCSQQLPKVPSSRWLSGRVSALDHFHGQVILKSPKIGHNASLLGTQHQELNCGVKSPNGSWVWPWLLLTIPQGMSDIQKTKFAHSAMWELEAHSRLHVFKSNICVCYYYHICMWLHWGN